ncbi:hypothetical protein DRB17_03200 [Ferruginivarius sediminum]|uniref:EF-hand domain-containing protein n=1 Tax=Ferruginivarius sediminum TaxID=2661937 RepID=A0A369TDR6_9PROT|nr:hypothetical protein DRB17_03200 [Ferruginivarius sediminum]
MKSVLMAGAAAVALLVAPAAINSIDGGFGINSAQAAQGEGQGQQKHGGQGGAGAGQGGMQKGGQEGAGGGSGSRLEEDVMRGKHGMDAAAEDGEEEDSDRPDWAGTPGREGKPGQGSQGGNTKKGEDYGDLWVIVRNDDGTPDLVDGMVQVVLSDGTVVALADYDGELPEEYADMVQEVEFGRMNIARSPERVLDHSLTEALTKLDGMVITVDNLDEVTDESGRLIDYFDNTIDSPLENLALYKALLEASASAPDADGLYTVSVTSDHEGESVELDIKVSADVLPSLAASALAASSDKTGDLSVDEIAYISGFLGVDDELAALVEDDPNDPSDAFFSYSRDAVYANTSIQVLLPNEDGTAYIPTTVYVVDTDVNGDGEYTALDTDNDGVIDTLEQGQVTFNTVPSIEADDDGLDIFTQAADDSVQVLEYVHDNAIDVPLPEATN